MSKLLAPRFVLSVTSVVALLILLSLGQEANRRWQVEREVTTLEQEANELQKNVTELQHLNEYFGTSAYQERLAREKLNYRAPGEEVVLIPEEDQQKETPASNQEVPKKEDSIALKWWHTFFVPGSN